jgi:hypothetical protein
VFVDLYFSNLEPIPRADIEAELEDRLPPGCTVVGSGAGRDVFNIDIEIPDRSALGPIVAILQSLGVRADTVLALSDTKEKVSLGDVAVR